MLFRLLGGILCVSTLWASHNGASGEDSAGAVELKVPNETQPAGGTVQVKFMPDPTSLVPVVGGGGRAAFATADFSHVLGIELFSRSGDVCGAAVIQGTQVQVEFISPNGTFGSDGTLPLLTMALSIGSSVSTGQSATLTLDSSSEFRNSSGQSLPVSVKAGTFTAGGTVSISNVVPGGGSWPAGTVVKLTGTGFQSGTTITASGLTVSSMALNSSSEIDLTLGESAVMDGQEIVAKNPDGSQDTYYSYLRGVPAAKSSVTLFEDTWPIFSTLTHSSASLGPLQSIPSTQMYGVGLQNPGSATAEVTLTLLSSSGSVLASSGMNLAFGASVAGALSEFLNGTTPPVGSTFSVSSSAPIQILGLLADTSANQVTPINPTF